MQPVSNWAELEVATMDAQANQSNAKLVHFLTTILHISAHLKIQRQL